MIWLIVGLFCVFLAGNLLLWVFFMPWYLERKIENFQNELVNKHYDEVENMYRRMRGWRHDYHNHIQSLKAYLIMNQYEEASRYLDRLEQDLTTVDTLVKSGNVMVDAILNSKLSLIQGRQIRVDATAAVPEDLIISEIELSVLLGNLLDNAMEACMQLPREERFIRIYIDIVKKQLYISVTNATAGRVEKVGGRFLSQKEGSHGFGLLRIDNIVAKYGGYLNRQTEQGIFATEVMLPLIR